MSFEVDLYTFSKKANSTKVPDTPTSTHNCIIKDPCGILSPVISLNLGLSNSPAAYNYAYIALFNRYYFIKEWTFENALWYATLEVDVLASWKTQIGALGCYILRSSADYDGAILDTTYPGTGSTTLTDQQDTSPWITDDIANGMFVVGIAGQSTTYYTFTQTQLDSFFEYLFSDAYAADLTSSWSSVYPQLKAQTNPLQYVTSIMWFPFNVSIGTTVSSVRVGWVDVPCVAQRVTGSGLVYGEINFTLDRHPQSARGSYLNNAPYSHYMLFFPPWGTIPLDSDVMANSTTISCIYGVDLRTGQGTLTIAGGTLHIMSWIQSQVGLHYQVSQVVNKGYGAGNIIGAAASVGGGIATGNSAGAISSIASEIGNFAASKIPSATTIGSNGGLDTLRGIPTVQYEFKSIVEEDNTNRGKPLCSSRQISTIPGYIKTANTIIDIPSTQNEKEQIILYMEGGFFYE